MVKFLINRSSNADVLKIYQMITDHFVRLNAQLQLHFGMERDAYHAHHFYIMTELSEFVRSVGRI
jgi:hypothetical protein